VTTKPVPPNIRINLPEPLGGVVVTFVQFIVPYYKAYKRPLNYPKYK
jgi:hypothetical protein